jgi:hypothetical protein
MKTIMPFQQRFHAKASPKKGEFKCATPKSRARAGGGTGRQTGL